MNTLNSFDTIALDLIEGKITRYRDELTGMVLKGFHPRLIRKNVPKLYVVKDSEDFLYVGVTSQSLTSRVRSGLIANGKNGYHGYKWKTRESIKLYAWCFPGLTQHETESVEAELVFTIRKEKGKWPITQNEIHFNNDFPKGKIIAAQLFQLLQPVHH